MTGILAKLEALGPENSVVFSARTREAHGRALDGMPWLFGAWDSFRLKVTNKYEVTAHISSVYPEAKKTQFPELRLAGLVVSPDLAAALKKTKKAVVNELATAAEASWLDPKIEVDLVADGEELEEALREIACAVWCAPGQCMCQHRKVRWSSVALK